jgi:TP53 regulating kinase-like protein
MHDAKKAGVPTPIIFLVDVRNATIIMEHIEGTQVKQLLNQVSEKDRKAICFRIGQEIAKLHRFGLIHGDLTTSNMIMSARGKVVFVDFGLGEKNAELEARGVDLHLMKRALQSTHYQFAESCFESVVEGYADVMHAETLKSVLAKIREIERRGRYVAERKQEDTSI